MNLKKLIIGSIVLHAFFLVNFISFIKCDKKVSVIRRIEKTVRKYPSGGGTPSEHRSVKTERFLRGENGELIDADEDEFKNKESKKSSSSKKSLKTVVLKDETVDELMNEQSERQKKQKKKSGLLRDVMSSSKTNSMGANNPGYQLEEDDELLDSKSSGKQASSDSGKKDKGTEETIDDWHELLWNDSDGPAHCGSGDWHQFNAYCYKLITGLFTWNEAQAACRLQNANLVSIHSKVENEFVAALSSQFNSNFNKFCEGYWIGMTRKKMLEMDEFKSEWVDGTIANYGHIPKVIQFYMPPFRGGQPDSPSNGIEECIHMYPKLDCDSNSQIIYGQWNDVSCFSQLNGAVCKKRRRVAT